jgi:hypothetical protein
VAISQGTAGNWNEISALLELLIAVSNCKEVFMILIHILWKDMKLSFSQQDGYIASYGWKLE